jgi:DNA invertase Pin-like site-specific DNA recombinase
VIHAHSHEIVNGQPVPTRAAGYVRVARTDAGGGLAVAGQEAVIRACAAAHGWQVAAVFTDPGSCRTARQQVLAGARAGRYDLLLVEAQDGLSRHGDAMMALLADQTGVQIHDADRCAGSAPPAIVGVEKGRP